MKVIVPIGLVLVAAASHAGGAEKTSIPLIEAAAAQHSTADRKLQTDLMPLVRTLVAAVLEKHADLLWRLDPTLRGEPFLGALPDGTQRYIFGPPRSAEYRSVYDILRSANRLHVAFQTYTIRNEDGDSVLIARAFVFDPERVRLKLPISPRLRSQWMKSYVTNRFVKTQEGWRVAFTLFDSESEGP